MSDLVVRVSGVDAVRVGQRLEGLVGVESTGLEIERDLELVVAVVGLVLSGAQTAKALWEWWEASRAERVTVTLVLSDGRIVDIDGLARDELEAALEEGA